MKKFMILPVLALVLGFSGHVSASVTCDYPNHSIWSEDNSAKVGCISQSDWDNAYALQINQSDANDFVKVGLGQRLMTTYGFEDGCPTWFPPSGCVIKKSIFVKFI